MGTKQYQQTYSYKPALIHLPQQNPRDYKCFEIAPASGALGAEIFGLDLSTINQAGFEEFKTALVDHLVLFVRDQKLDLDDLVTFTKKLGKPLSYPTSDPVPGYPTVTEFRSKPDSVYNFGGSSWHSDSMFMEIPPKFTVLYNLECPDVGGDTSFSNQYLAWETLDESLQTEVENCQAVNSAAISLLGFPKDKDTDRAPAAYKGDSAEVWQREAIHPVVRTHPDTGKKALYVCDSYTANFVGMTQQQSLPLLRSLYAHSTLPDLTCRFRWRKGTLAIWDNRCCLHYAHNDHAGQARAMRRVIIEGERPV